MAAYTEQLTQGLAYADVVNYVSANNTNATSLGVDLSKYKRAIWYINLWTTTAGTGTVDGRLQGSANANFTGNTNIQGTNITQLTANNTGTSVEIRADQLETASSLYKYVRLQLTTATNACTVSAIGLGGEAMQSPASQNNLNSTFFATAVVCSL